MKTLHKYKPTIQHDGEFFIILGEHKESNTPRERLGELVAYYGGDKVLGYNGYYLICSRIQDAQYELI